MTGIRLGEGLTLPADIATQTLLVVGKRGSGKSTTCVRLAEQFFRAKVPFVVIDPTDTWWGLKAGEDGKSLGIGVYVFGGRHEDLPLEPASGQLVADIVIDHRISCVLSMKHFSGRERGRFVSDFTDRLFKRNTDPLHLFLEEAHEVAPQNPFKGEEEMLGRVNRIWKLGRSSGLGGSAITQRPASLSKNITTQAEILIVHRMIGPQDVAAVREWIKYHGESDEVLSQLSELKTGEAWIWAPDFPEDKPIGLKRVKIFNRETFDSSATPRAGKHRIEPKDLAPVDLDALRIKMTATIERAKQEDPRELRKQLVEARRQISELQSAMGRSTVKVEVPVEIPVLKDGQITRLEKIAENLRTISGKLADPIDQMAKQGISITEAIKKYSSKPVSFVEVIKAEVHPGLVNRYQRGIPPSKPMASQRIIKDEGDETPRTLRLGERRMLDVLCRWYPGRLTKAQLATLSHLRVSGGTFTAYFGVLKRAQLIDEAPNGIQITNSGLALAGIEHPYSDPRLAPQTTREVVEMWRRSLRAGERRLLDILVEIYPKGISRSELAERTELTANAGTFSNYFGTLRRNGLAEVSGDQVMAGEVLFLQK